MSSGGERPTKDHDGKMKGLITDYSDGGHDYSLGGEAIVDPERGAVEVQEPPHLKLASEFSGKDQMTFSPPG